MIDWFIIPDHIEDLEHLKNVLPLTSSLFDRGWGNGYVAVTKSHPWYQKQYEDVDFNEQELTFSDYGSYLRHCPKHLHRHWVLGFDTGHSYNNKSHDMEWVANETVKLYAEACVIALKNKFFNAPKRKPNEPRPGNNAANM